MGDAHKMRHLLDAIRGEAPESLKQFENCRRTHGLGIERLKKTYGNKELFVTEHIERLEKCHARSRRMEDQRRMCEELSSIVNQLELQGEATDNALVQ